MSEYYATVVWERNGQTFTDNKYSRAHRWEFDGGAIVAASPSPHVVPAPMSVAENVDPEEAYVAAISSCHMLFFLSVAATRGFTVDQYVDEAVGVMDKNQEGRMAMVKVTLDPAIQFSGDRRPTREDVQKIHHRAHQMCFIANSVKTEIDINIRES